MNTHITEATSSDETELKSQRGLDHDSISFRERSIWIGGLLESDATDTKLHELFSQFGKVVHVQACPRAVDYRGKLSTENALYRSWALVSFENERTAGKVLHTEVWLSNSLLVLKAVDLQKLRKQSVTLWITAKRKSEEELEMVHNGTRSSRRMSVVNVRPVIYNDDKVNPGNTVLYESNAKWAFATLQYYAGVTVLSTHFENTSVVVVLLNCIVLALQHPLDRTSDTARALQHCDTGFSFFFAVEAIVKITALGFWDNEGAYFRNVWNRLDFCLAVFGVLEVFFDDLQAGPGALRAVRALRPLRTLTRSPALQILIYSIMTSIPQLRLVLLLLCLLFFTFGLIAVRMWMGSFYNRCFGLSNVTSVNFELNTSAAATQYIVDAESSVLSAFYTARLSLCDPHKLGRHCPEGLECRPSKFNPNWDIVSFDNIFSAWLLVFQTITLSNWGELQPLLLVRSLF